MRANPSVVACASTSIDYEDCFGDGNPDRCEAASGDIAIMVGSTNLSVGSSSTPGTGSAHFICTDVPYFAARSSR